MKLTLLGTGTSQGVPVIGCNCSVCTSSDPQDKRLRTSALLSHGDINILIDCGPDLRQQMLRTQTQHVEAILLTHEHNDHVIGLDDVRPFNFRSGKPMPVYALPRVQEEVRKRFEYVFGDPIPGLPRVHLVTALPNSPFTVEGIAVQPIGVWHGDLPILGYRFGNLAYLTDVKCLEEDAIAELQGIQYLVLNALHHKPHPTHLNLTEALKLIEKIQPQNTWLTHLSHHFGRHSDWAPQLPKNVYIGFDGLEITAD